MSVIKERKRNVSINLHARKCAREKIASGLRWIGYETTLSVRLAAYFVRGQVDGLSLSLFPCSLPSLDILIKLFSSLTKVNQTHARPRTRDIADLIRIITSPRKTHVNRKIAASTRMLKLRVM
ncbi:hypothetical protein PUN28_002777 [Cardiocondyla obscurior]|uniref:Uncharacterized protein n=1 Tax=Cardiocondyla obscurior TaxID=286306 RepID=A0AAW2GWD8_9HYME